MVFPDSLAPPRRERLPCAQNKNYSGKHLPHRAGLQLFRKPAAQNPSDENARNQQQSGFPGNVTCLGIGQKGKQARWRNQRNKASALRAMLRKRKKQYQERDEENPTADPKQTRCYPAGARRHKNARATQHALSHGPAPRLRRPSIAAGAAIFSRATPPPTSGNNQRVL